MLKEIMDKRELAAALGVPTKRIENLVNRKEYSKLPPMLPRQAGEKWYWSGRTVEKWLESQSAMSSHVPSPSSIPAEKRGRGRPRKAA